MKRSILLLCTYYIITMQCISVYPSNTIDDCELSGNEQPLRKVEKICRLCVGCLNVTKHLFVNGQEITGESQGGTSLLSYGRLSTTEQDITFQTADEWVPIPFDAVGPISNMSGSTTSPATITVQQDGVYQVNVSLYFSVENSDEDTFTVTTYTFGINVNGVTTPAAAVYVGEPGTFSLNYSNLMNVSASDTIQFYMQASAADGPPFANNVTLQNSNAHVLQISG